MSRRAPILLLGLLILVLVGCARSQPVATPAPMATGASSEGGRLVYVQIDVGQGDSQLIVAPDGPAMLVDGGPPGRREAILAALAAHGVSRLDVAVASHPHNDHIGSLDDLIASMPVAQFLDSGYSHGSDAQQRLLRTIKERRVPFRLVRAGQRFPLGKHVWVTVLAPRMPLITGTDSDANNNSVVLKVSYGEVNILLTGDMEVRQRERLYADGADLAAEIYKVAHHGSHNGTDAELLRRVRPQAALISCARGNDYGHPHREVLDALTSAGTRIYRTDLHGSLTLTTDGRDWQMAAERASQIALTTPGRELSPGGAGGTGEGTDGVTAGRATPTRGEGARARPGDGTAAGRGRIIGNRRSKVYHVGAGSRLPAEENRVYFRTEEEARRAGYRPVGAASDASAEADRAARGARPGARAGGGSR